MFKKIMNALLNAETESEKAEATGMINKAFENGKITWKDHELLYKLVAKLNPEWMVHYEDFKW